MDETVYRLERLGGRGVSRREGGERVYVFYRLEGGGRSGVYKLGGEGRVLDGTDRF